jgi:hypothetical protein
VICKNYKTYLLGVRTLTLNRGIKNLSKSPPIRTITRQMKKAKTTSKIKGNPLRRNKLFKLRKSNKSKNNHIRNLRKKAKETRLASRKTDRESPKKKSLRPRVPQT